jgi:hypothetical protein
MKLFTYYNSKKNRLDSKFGEIKIVNKNGFWEWLTNTRQINLIKTKIIKQLILQNI